MQDVLRFWLERGAAGYRVDAIDRLLKDAQLRDDPPASEPFGLPLRPDEAALALSMSRNAPDTGEALAKIRAATGDALLVGEVYCPPRAGSLTSRASTPRSPSSCSTRAGTPPRCIARSRPARACRAGRPG